MDDVKANCGTNWEPRRAYPGTHEEWLRESAKTVLDVDLRRAMLAGAAALAAPRPSEAEQAHGYLSRLFLHFAPQCEPLPDLMGLCTQIDNLLAGRVERPAPSIMCPLCGEEVRQVASATLGLALSQHVNWACPRGRLAEPVDVQAIAAVAWECIKRCKDYEMPPVMCPVHQEQAKRIAAQPSGKREAPASGERPEIEVGDIVTWDNGQISECEEQHWADNWNHHATAKHAVKIQRVVWIHPTQPLFLPRRLAGANALRDVATLTAQLEAAQRERDALRAQFKATGHVPYLDRMRELAERAEAAQAEATALREALAKARVIVDAIRAGDMCADAYACGCQVSQAWHELSEFLDKTDPNVGGQPPTGGQTT